MRRVAPFALVSLLLASVYPMLSGQDAPKGIVPNPATSGAIVVEPPVDVAPNAARSVGGPGLASLEWEYRVVSSPDIWDGTVGADDRKAAEAAAGRLDTLGADGWEYCGLLRDGAYMLFKKPKF